MKWAMSMDGRVGLKNGESKWITNKDSRALVHFFRACFDAIIIGGNTLRKDAVSYTHLTLPTNREV